MSNEISDIKLTKSGIVITSNGEDKRITNFTGEIVEEIEIYDNDDVVSREILIKAKYKGDCKTIKTTVDKFNDSSWIPMHIGPDAELFDIKPKELPAIINKASKNKIKKKSVNQK